MSKFLRCVISCKWTLGKTPRNIPALCSWLVKRIQTRSLYLGFVLCLSVLSSPNLTLCNVLCFLYLNRDWALSVGIPLGYITMAFWTSVFILFFGIHNKIVLHFSVQLHRWRVSPPLFLQGSKLKALRRTSRSPRLAAWKSSGWSIRERAILRAAQIFPEIAGWGTCCWFLLFLCKLRAVRKLLTASLRG